MVTITGGEVDLFKVQMLAFTTLIILFVLFRLIRSEAFPELSENLLLLMGVSQSIYVGSKLIPSDPQAQMEAARLELETLRERKSNLKTPPSGEIVEQKTTREKELVNISKAIESIEEKFPQLKEAGAQVAE